MAKLTQKALAKSLEKIALEKPINKITISEIVTDCGVNRQTFYYHFKDIYDLLEWIYDINIEEIISKNTSLYSVLLGLLNFSLDHKAFVIKTYNSIDREYSKKYLYAKAYAIIEKALVEVEESKKLSAKEITFIINFYKYSLVGIYIDWIEKNMKEKPEELLFYLGKITSNDFSNIIKNFK